MPNSHCERFSDRQAWWAPGCTISVAFCFAGINQDDIKGIHLRLRETDVARMSPFLRFRQVLGTCPSDPPGGVAQPQVLGELWRRLTRHDT